MMIRYIILPWLVGLLLLLTVFVDTSLLPAQDHQPVVSCPGGDNPDWIATVYVNGEEIQRKVGRMPVFPGCDEDPTCTRNQLLAFTSRHLELTAEQETRRYGLREVVWLTFVVRADGQVTDIKIQQDPGYGFGAAAVAALATMEEQNLRWEPGHERGVAVPVQLSLRLSLGKLRCGN